MDITIPLMVVTVYNIRPFPPSSRNRRERLRSTGLFITDKVLWHGRVLPGRGDSTAETRGVEEFARRLLDHPGFFTTILPVRDGVVVSLKL